MHGVAGAHNASDCGLRVTHSLCCACKAVPEQAKARESAGISAAEGTHTATVDCSHEAHTCSPLRVCCRSHGTQPCVARSGKLPTPNASSTMPLTPGGCEHQQEQYSVIVQQGVPHVAAGAHVWSRLRLGERRAVKAEQCRDEHAFI